MTRMRIRAVWALLVSATLLVGGCSACADRLLSSERVLYRCTACQADAPSQCATYADDCEHDVRWSASETEARRRAQEALCTTRAVPPEARDGISVSCPALPAERFRFQCTSWKARCAAPMK